MHDVVKHTHPLLWVVILNWNLPLDTVDCVESVLAAGIPAERIVLVDNGSIDGSVTCFQKNLPATIQLLPLTKNVGFAGGNNEGIRLALAMGAKWIMLLNNDTIVSSDVFNKIMALASVNPEIGLWSPLICHFPQQQQDTIWSLGDMRIAKTLLTRSLCHNELIPTNLPSLVEVDFLTACALIVRRDVFEKIGLLDEAYFVYAEDADFCLRAKRNGYKLACATQARIWHKVSRSTAGALTKRHSMKTINQIRFYRSHAALPHLILLMIFTLVKSSALAINACVTRRDLALAGTIMQTWRRGWTMRLQ